MGRKFARPQMRVPHLGAGVPSGSGHDVFLFLSLGWEPTNLNRPL
jgi:hypothetical protein